MRRRATWLCLWIALAGPLASEAKLASGLALSLAEIGQNLYESAAEDADEDYNGHELLAVTVNAPPEIDTLTALPRVLDFLTPGFLLDLPPAASSLVRHRHGQSPWPPPTAQKRHALLQTFLI
jgi:hypothetical protein